MNSHDYFMREIERIAEFLGNTLLSKQPRGISLTDKAGNVTSEGFLYNRLMKLVSAGEINAAENLLYEQKESGSKDINIIEVGVAFYTHLEDLSDDKLKLCGFSREEIRSGLHELCCTL